VEQVAAEWAERIEMDSAIPEKTKRGVSVAASKAYDKAKKSATGH
jgi:hypothetical protein